MTAQHKLHHIVNHPPSTTSSSYEEVVIGWILNNLHESIALTGFSPNHQAYVGVSQRDVW